MRVGKWEKYKIFFSRASSQNSSKEKDENVLYGHARNKDAFALVEHDKKIININYQLM